MSDALDRFKAGLKKYRINAKEKIKKPERFKRHRPQILCVAISIVLSALSYVSDANNSVLINGNTVERGAPGDSDKSYELNVGGISAKNRAISFKVSHREYTESEALQRFDALMEELAVHIVGSNESLDRIITDLGLPKEIDGFEGIRLSWYPEDTNLVGYDGSVNNMELEEAKSSVLNVRLSSGNTSEEYAIPITVLPAETFTEAEIVKKLEELISEADEEQINLRSLTLPENIMGFELSYHEKEDRTYLKILALGIFSAILLKLKPEQDKRKEAKRIENELLIDYAEVVSKLMVYMGAGLAARNAWIRIADNYREQYLSGHTCQRKVYEEMCTAAEEMKNGVSESRAYSAFAKRCSLKCYMKLVSLLEQNRKNGDPRLAAAMELEMQEAFEQRKNTARRLGEEAGTKLLLPLMMSLFTVLLIVAVPAMLTLA